jgi:hypothetical protein
MAAEHLERWAEKVSLGHTGWHARILCRPAPARGGGVGAGLPCPLHQPAEAVAGGGNRLRQAGGQLPGRRRDRRPHALAPHRIRKTRPNLSRARSPTIGPSQPCMAEPEPRVSPFYAFDAGPGHSATFRIVGGLLLRSNDKQTCYGRSGRFASTRRERIVNSMGSFGSTVTCTQ